MLAQISEEQMRSSPFYRVTAKALIFNGDDELLVLQAADDTWEMPGGGWEYDESYEECIQRELEEELGVRPVSVGQVEFVYRAQRVRGGMTLRIAARAILPPGATPHPSDGMRAFRFVPRTDLATVAFHPDEAPIAGYADQIWPE